MSGNLWQHPYVNVFKYFDVGKWKKSAKEGDVITCMDKVAKCTVYKISGVIPANNYIQLPKTGSQSLGLTGRYLYLAFRPQPERYFVMHIDVASADGLVIRISFSNLFKEFKSTSTWLQFPFVVVAEHDTVEYQTSRLSKQAEPCAAPSSTRWTLLSLDLQYMLSIYLNRTYSHVKTVRLCANTLVKGVYTSDNYYEPGVTADHARKMGLNDRGIHALPSELSFPLRKSDDWHEKYDLIRFPTESTKLTIPPAMSSPTLPHGKQRSKSSKTSVRKAASCPVTNVHKTSSSKSGSTKVLHKKAPEPLLPEVGLLETGHFSDDKENEPREVHVVSKDSPIRRKIASSKSSTRNTSHRVRFPLDPDAGELPGANYKSLQPDPILKLKKVIGFGGATDRYALWTQDGSCIVYPCHALVVSLHVTSNRQRFFIGHTDKVSCISMNRDCTLLASGQTGQSCSVRIWSYKSSDCLSVFKVNSASSLHCLHFADSGSLLTAAGIDNHNKTLISVWNTSRILRGGEANLTAKAHTEVEVSALKVSPSDESRFVSCGRNNIRLWRLKESSLRSAAVPLGEHHLMEFTDICWDYQPSSTADLRNKKSTERSIYACSRSGHIFEIDHNRMRISNVHRLLPHTGDKQTMASGAGVAINSIYANDTFCVTGSSDGFLRVWPLDFKHVYLEAEHDGPVSAVQMSDNGLKILAATSTGNLGVLDVTTRSYQTMMRSHTDSVLSLSQDVFRRHMTTVSADHTIRVWSLDSGQQLYDFHSPNECPTNISYHPSKQLFVVGFDEGSVRVFDIQATNLIADHCSHKGAVTGLAYTGDGQRLFSSAADGTLCLYDASDDLYTVVRLLGSIVAKGSKYSPGALSVSPHGNFVAFVGPEAFTVTVVSATTLDEVMRIDVTAVTSPVEAARGLIDTAQRVFYTPAHINHLIVTTENSRLLKFDASSGKLLSEVGSVHREPCTGLDISKCGRYLVTAGDRVVKVWDYQMRYDLNFQVYIGASDKIHKVSFSPSYNQVISCGEAIFIWQFLGDDSEENSQCVSEGAEDINAAIADTSVHHSPSAGVKVIASHSPSPKKGSRRSLNTSLSAIPRSSAPQRFSSPEREEPIALSALTPLCNVDNQRGGGGDHPSYPQGHDTAQEFTSPSKPERTGQHSRLERTSQQYKPTCRKHFQCEEKHSTFAQKRYVSPEDQAGLKLKACLGYNGNGRDNVIWQPETGFFAYTSGCVIVLEDLKTGEQKHLTGHIEEISTLAVQSDCQEMVSASGVNQLGCLDSSSSQLCFWDLSAMSCRKVANEHTFNIVSLAYSRDDRFLVSLGDYRERKINLWETSTCALLATTTASQAIHFVAWDPQAFNEFVTVGDGAAIMFWLVDELTDNVPKLRVQEPKVPEDILSSAPKVDFTCASYAADRILYVGSSVGVISAWDTKKNCCLLHWSVDKCEIGSVIARRGQLITGSTNKKCLRLWSIAGLSELLLPTNSQSSPPPAVQVEDEMSLDGFVTAMMFDETLDMGIVGTECGSIWYINWQEHSSVRLVTSNSSNINAIEFCSDSSKFVTCADDGSLKVWLVEDREQILQFHIPEQRCLCAAFAPMEESRSVFGVEHRPYLLVDGERLDTCILASGYADGTLRVFDIIKAEMILKVQPHRKSVTAINYGSSSILISGDEEGFIALTSAHSGMTIRIINDHKGAPLENIDISSWKQPMAGDDVGCVYWLACSADRRVSVWSADWSKDKCTLIDWLTFPAPSFGPDLRQTGGRGHSKNRSVPPSIAKFSVCERDVVVYTGYSMTKSIQFYNLCSKSVVRSISLTHWARCLHLSGSLIATGVNERLVQLHDYNEGTFQDYIGNDDSVSLVRFSPDGKHLLTAVNKYLNLWQVML